MSDTSTILTCSSCGARSRVRPVPRGTPRCGRCKAALAWVVPATTESFGDEVSSSVPVVVDLWAPWCGPCRQVSPVLERLARERAGSLKVVKVNVDEEPALSARFAVQSIPLLLLMRDGEEIGRMVGAARHAKLSAWIDAQTAAA
jgi:thioredoxin 2